MIDHDPIVITGFGLVSALGSDIPKAVASIRDKQTGVVACDNLDPAGFYAMVSGFQAQDYVPKKKVRRMDPVNCYAIASARMALDNAGLERQCYRDCGVILGTGFSGFKSVVNHQRKLIETGIAQLTPIHFPTTVYNASAGLVAIELGLKGVNSTVTGLHVSGEYALFYAWLLLKKKMSSHIVAIGADELSEPLLKGFNDLGLLFGDGIQPAKTFSGNEQGIIPGEGAGAFVLESLSSAQGRNANILGVIEGFGVYNEADSMFAYTTNPRPAARSIENALRQSHRDAEEIAWVSSSANGIRNIYRCEREAIRSVFQSRPTVALSSYIGGYASSGIARMGLALSSMNEGLIPQDPHLDEPSPHQLPAGAQGLFVHTGSDVGGSSIAAVVSTTPA